MSSYSQADKVDAMEIRLSQLVMERDSVTEETQGLQNQLDKAKAMVRPVHEHEARCRVDSGLCPQPT